MFCCPRTASAGETILPHTFRNVAGIETSSHALPALPSRRVSTSFAGFSRPGTNEEKCTDRKGAVLQLRATAAYDGKPQASVLAKSAATQEDAFAPRVTRTSKASSARVRARRTRCLRGWVRNVRGIRQAPHLHPDRSTGR